MTQSNDSNKGPDPALYHLLYRTPDLSTLLDKWGSFLKRFAILLFQCLSSQSTLSLSIASRFKSNFSTANCTAETEEIHRVQAAFSPFLSQISVTFNMSSFLLGR